ncbi:MAG: response regulator transcription factor [Dehalococcoidales bacterium]
MADKEAGLKSILAIDDDPNVLKLLESTLRPEGYQVIVAADGAYGMTLLNEEKPDLVLLDIGMPGPDGYMVLERIRACSAVPVIILSGALDADSVQKCLDLGADDYVRKPFSPRELVARIQVKLRNTG